MITTHPWRSAVKCLWYPSSPLLLFVSLTCTVSEHSEPVFEEICRRFLTFVRTSISHIRLVLFVQSLAVAYYMVAVILLLAVMYHSVLILKYLVYNFQTTYIGIAMLNSYATKFHLSYISSSSSNVLVYQQTI